MNEFPSLKTGAAVQYPLERSLIYFTQVVRFLDGSEQRYREFTSPLKRWIIRLDLLDEQEMDALSQFFAGRQGETQTFSFVDPWDGTEHANCRLDTPELALHFADHDRGRTILVVRESRG